MAVSIETNEDYEAAALRLGELSREQVETVDHEEFEQISAAMMSFEARRLSPALAAPVGSRPRDTGEA
ncbi:MULTISPECIES: hypothetical protein [unclassified Bosea (in: a-proteobacteria)]|uniref:hypothetical protein n=1 Tax=unclassified Bosea (in: a-proteobacteria) TaxID=2653178 RepID=UPI0009562830|nr:MULTISPECIES: hypothetical protein [unclassified Bosea (in: a-proteobacteria)]TAJ29710.1 MAG: hypothetical protein EPO59_14095 [Bosea sp. (in: a-proteobacteria)]SIQ58182.1 hypothetical protein SAMN05880592_10434 [Bosea sp. TND4EK4]